MKELLNYFISVSVLDWIIAFSGFFIILCLVISIEYAVLKLKVRTFFARKFIHITTGLIIVLVSYGSQSKVPITLFAFVYMFFDFWSLRKGKIRSIHQNSESYGTVYYAFSVLTLALLFWDSYKPIFIITNLIMIIPDAFAALVGERYAKNFFQPLGEKKSIINAGQA